MPANSKDSEPAVAELQEQIDDLHEQLMQAQKMGSVGVLASSITHEFNNILTTVINYAKMGLRHKDAATRDKAFNRILNSSQRASKITTGMLRYARHSSNRQEPTDLAELVENCLVLVEKDLQIHRVRLDLDLSQRPLASVNSGQIQQVLLNLIVNARQAMESGGRLCVAVRANAGDGRAEISIRDSGRGIPHDVLPRIFDPFYSTKRTDQSGQGGTGLGLALCRDIIEAHGGRIRVESTIGRGTTFILRFPLVEHALMAARDAVFTKPAGRSIAFVGEAAAN